MPRPEPSSVAALARALVLAVLLGGCSWMHAKPPAPPPAVVVAPAEPPPDTTLAATPDAVPPIVPSQPKKPPERSPPKRPVAGEHEALGVADIGYYMDVLQGHLMQVVGKVARIERRGDDILVSVPYAAGFEPGSAKLTVAGRARLKPLAEALATFRLTMLAVQLRGDEASPAAASLPLASQRVSAVARYLSDAGIAGRRITTPAGAPLRPPATEASAVDRLQIELELTPLVAANASAL